jgi:hypothetical protein
VKIGPIGCVLFLPVVSPLPWRLEYVNRYAERPESALPRLCWLSRPFGACLGSLGPTKQPSSRTPLPIAHPARPEGTESSVTATGSCIFLPYLLPLTSIVV